jgi:hypothetical protein
MTVAQLGTAVEISTSTSGNVAQYCLSQQCGQNPLDELSLEESATFVKTLASCGHASGICAVHFPSAVVFLPLLASTLRIVI